MSKLIFIKQKKIKNRPNNIIVQFKNNRLGLCMSQLYRDVPIL